MTKIVVHVFLGWICARRYFFPTINAQDNNCSNQRHKPNKQDLYDLLRLFGEGVSGNRKRSFDIQPQRYCDNSNQEGDIHEMSFP